MFIKKSFLVTFISSFLQKHSKIKKVINHDLNQANPGPDRGLAADVASWSR